jgi:hypothetical protein
MAVKTYEETLDEHIAWLQKQLNKAAAFRYKREQYMYGTPLPQLKEKWMPLLQGMNNIIHIETAIMHLEYASHFIEEHNIARWKSILIPAIVEYYREKDREEPW